jgi:hypothetical protein
MRKETECSCNEAIYQGPILLSATAIPRDAVPDAARRGLVFVKTNCSRGHAIGKLDESPLPHVPPLREESIQSLAG